MVGHGQDQSPVGGRRWSLKTRLLGAFLPALLGPCQLLLFGPQTLYGGNAGEFILPLRTLIAPLLLVLLATTAVLLGLALLCPNRLYPVLVALYFGAGLALWLQGNLFLGEYGLFDGSGIDWDEHSASVVGQAALWIALPSLLAVFGRRIGSLASRASGVLIVAQLLLLSFSVVRPSDAGGSGRTGWSEPPTRMFQFSRAQNIVHFVLDGFQGDVFSQVVRESDALRRELSGFVLFEDHAGAFRTTSMSIPAMLTGVAYRNEARIRGVIARSFTERSLFTVLVEHGYEVDFTSITGEYFSGPITGKYFLPRPYVGYEDHRRASTAQLFDLSLFRHAPPALKKRVYNDQEWLLQQQEWFLQNLSSANRIHHSSNGRAFLRDLTRRMRIAREVPVYKLLHVGIPHAPVVLDGECRFTGVARATREASVEQARCAVETIVGFLRRLRDLKIYDGSLVLLTSDHGGGLASPLFVPDSEPPTGDLRRIAGYASALLVVKRPGDTGPLTVSQAPTSITDISATILDAMTLPADLPGVSAFRLDPTQDREREYAHYAWSNSRWGRDYLPTLEVYSIRGRLQRSSSWSHLKTIPAPTAMGK